MQVSAGRVAVSPRDSPLIAVRSGTHLARDHGLDLSLARTVQAMISGLRGASDQCGTTVDVSRHVPLLQ